MTHIPDDITHKRLAMEDYADHLISALLAGRDEDAQFCIDYLTHAQQQLKARGFAARLDYKGRMTVETVTQNERYLRREEEQLASTRAG